MQTTKEKEIPNKTELKNIKHVFTPEERNQIGGDLARSIAALRGHEADFDNVKAGFKAKLTASEAQIDNLSTSLMNGFDMRNVKCVVVYRPKDRKKDYFIEEEHARLNGDTPPILTEDMTPGDFQSELVQAESKFDKREEIALFKSTETDRGVLVVGRLGDKWFSALRITIGKLVLEERLDSEQKCFKKRFDAVDMASKRAWKWLKQELKEQAGGFEAGLASMVDAHRERVE